MVLSRPQASPSPTQSVRGGPETCRAWNALRSWQHRPWAGLPSAPSQTCAATAGRGNPQIPRAIARDSPHPAGAGRRRAQPRLAAAPLGDASQATPGRVNHVGEPLEHHPLLRHGAGLIAASTAVIGSPSTCAGSPLKQVLSLWKRRSRVSTSPDRP